MLPPQPAGGATVDLEQDGHGVEGVDQAVPPPHPLAVRLVDKRLD